MPKKPPKRRTPPKRQEGPPRLAASGFQISFDDMENAYRVTDKAKAELVRRGIKTAERPSTRESDFTDEQGFPQIPINLMKLSNNELGELYSIVDAWKAYIAGQVSEASVKHKEVLKHAELVESKVRLQKEGLKQADKTAAVRVDVRYVAAQEEALESEAFLTLMRDAVENMETTRKTISRIISLRDQEVRSGSRLAGIGARRSFAGHMPPDKEDDPDVPPPKPRRAPPRRPSNRSKR